jgi:hypothetical protein
LPLIFRRLYFVEVSVRERAGPYKSAKPAIAILKAVIKEHPQ